MQLLVTFVFTLLVAFCAARPSNHKEWDHFVMAQEWPQSICWELDVAEYKKCNLPHGTNFWTIHGLWPSCGSTLGPNTCTDDKFDESLIKPIEKELNLNWPNILPSEKYSFWKHEWEKHGTCALSMEELDSEFKYFSKVLELHKTYDLKKRLENAGFGPSDETLYQYEELNSALESALGAKGLLMCYVPKDEPVQYLAQIEFCLDTSFEVMECPHHHKEPKLQYASESISDLETSKHGSDQVFKMRIPNNNVNQYERNEHSNGKLKIIKCSQNKDISYPVIHHV